MSFDEEHLEDHHECQREVAERDARILELAAEIARLNMEMAAYRQGCTPKDAAAMLAVVDALEAEKASRCGPRSDSLCRNMMHKRYAMLNCTECSPSSDAPEPPKEST